MTINCDRWQQVNFSTDYYDAGQRVLVPEHSAVKGIADLGGKKVCAAAGSTSIVNIAAATSHPVPVSVTDWTDCLVLLQQGQVDAISTDDTILAGLAAQDPNTTLVGDRFTSEPYGLAIARRTHRLRPVRQRGARPDARRRYLGGHLLPLAGRPGTAPRRPRSTGTERDDQPGRRRPGAGRPDRGPRPDRHRRCTRSTSTPALALLRGGTVTGATPEPWPARCDPEVDLLWAQFAALRRPARAGARRCSRPAPAGPSGARPNCTRAARAEPAVPLGCGRRPADWTRPAIRRPAVLRLGELARQLEQRWPAWSLHLSEVDAAWSAVAARVGAGDRARWTPSAPLADRAGRGRTGASGCDRAARRGAAAWISPTR